MAYMAGVEAMAILLAAVMFWYAWSDVLGTVTHAAISHELVRGVCWKETMSLDDLIVRAGGRTGDIARRHGSMDGMSDKGGKEWTGHGRYPTGGGGMTTRGGRNMHHSLMHGDMFGRQISRRRERRKFSNRQVKVGTKRILRGGWDGRGTRSTIGEGWIGLGAFSPEQRVSVEAFDVDSDGRLAVRKKQWADRHACAHAYSHAGRSPDMCANTQLHISSTNANAYIHTCAHRSVKLSIWE
jgi:hypothetical protein